MSSENRLFKGSFYSNEASTKQLRLRKYLSTDKHGRLYLSEGTKELMGIREEDLPVSIYVGYDKDNKRIALAKVGDVQLEGVIPFKFNGKRTYASVRTFLQDNRILPKEGTNRYIYIGQENGVYVFQLKGFVPDEE